MNLITADFNWISFLIIIGATIFGMVRSAHKKQGHKPVLQEPDFQPEEENKLEEEHTNPVFEKVYTPRKVQEPAQAEVIATSDYYRERIKTEPDEENPIYNPIEEEDKEDRIQFDIRQAIISSEILRRPQF